MAVWASGVWATGVWADDVWYGLTSQDDTVDDSEQYGGSIIVTTIRAFPPRARPAGARKGKPYSTDPDLDYEKG